MSDLSGEVANLPADQRNRRMDRTVLLIEDNDMARKTIIRMLQRIGYEVTGASSGEEGLRLIQQTTPSLVITDMVMPGQGGADVIRAIKASKPETRILAISGGGRLDSSDSLAEAEEAGADATLCKPFTVAELREATTKLIA